MSDDLIKRLRGKWVCQECGSKHFAQCDEEQPDGHFAPGYTLRCVECKTLDFTSAYSDRIAALEAQIAARPAPADPVAEAVQP